jgi:hypothetical protein
MSHEGGGITRETQTKKLWVTLKGLPLTIKLDWPFHLSTSGADFWVLHGDMVLEPKDAEAPVINALRKEVDRRQIEFLKSGKLLPVPFSSRHYDFKRAQWVFGKATDDAMAEFIERKVFWHAKLSGEARVWIGDPAEAQYVQTTPAHLIEIAARLVAVQGLIRIEGEYAEGTPGLVNQADRFESERRAALEELEKKHAFERG